MHFQPGIMQGTKHETDIFWGKVMEVKGIRLVPQNLEEGGVPLNWKHDQKSVWKCSDETVYKKED